MRLLHSFQLIHKDIKPENIVYSKSSNELVLVDFGLSCAIDEPLGFKSVAYREGTYSYMSDEMKKVPNDEMGFVDLYWNDASALKKVISRTKTGRRLGSINFREVLTKAAIAEDSALRLAYAAYAQTAPETEDQAAVSLATVMVGAYLPGLQGQA